MFQPGKRCKEQHKKRSAATAPIGSAFHNNIVAAAARGGGVHGISTDMETNVELLLLISTPATDIDMAIASDSPTKDCNTPPPLQVGATVRMTFPGYG